MKAKFPFTSLILLLGKLNQNTLFLCYYLHLASFSLSEKSFKTII